MKRRARVPDRFSSVAAAAYLENFLNLPVGSVVPVGSYDFKFGRWVPESNGRVVRVLAIEGATARLDVDGSNSAASDVDLTALGVTTTELQMVAQLYSVGESLWRAPVQQPDPI
jgi:hypothetical protein